MNTAESISDDEQYRQMEAEWQAWGDVCKVWRTDIGEIDDAKFNRVVKTLRRWAEYVAALRAEQSPALVMNIRDDANEAFASL